MNMAEKSSLQFRFKKIDETRNYLLDEKEHNDLMSGKYKKTCKYLNLCWTLAYWLLVAFQFLHLHH